VEVDGVGARTNGGAGGLPGKAGRAAAGGGPGRAAKVGGACCSVSPRGVPGGGAAPQEIWRLANALGIGETIQGTLLPVAP
jgi:hypothetical protein